MSIEFVNRKTFLTFCRALKPTTGDGRIGVLRFEHSGTQLSKDEYESVIRNVVPHSNDDGLAAKIGVDTFFLYWPSGQDICECATWVASGRNDLKAFLSVRELQNDAPDLISQYTPMETACKNAIARYE